MLTIHDWKQAVEEAADGSTIGRLYWNLRTYNPDMTGEELRDAFLWVIQVLMERGILEFRGEGWIKEGVGKDSPLMFGDKPFGPDDILIDGLKQPADGSPRGVAALIRSKWPTPVKATDNVYKPGFNPLWFEKWQFRWDSDRLDRLASGAPPNRK